MSWIPTRMKMNKTVLRPMPGENVMCRLSSGKVLELQYDEEGDWVDPGYLPMRVTFLNVTHWAPIGSI